MTQTVDMSALQNARAALCALAMREGENEAQIRAGIQFAIGSAMRNADPAARRFWQTLPHEGASPSPEELIAYLAARLREAGFLEHAF